MSGQTALTINKIECPFSRSAKIISIKKIEVLSLLQKIAIGDHKAFETLHKMYEKKVFEYIRLSGLSKGLLEEDIRQDVFEKLWTSRNKMHLINSFESYLFRVVRNHILDEHKKTNFRIEALHDYSENHFEHIDEILARESTRLFNQKVAHLPGRQREVSDLYFNCGLNTTEIAKRTGLSGSAVKTHLSRAKKRLRPLKD
jgi:RNA polymerase sigma factor (sigma-70 family)